MNTYRIPRIIIEKDLCAAAQHTPVKAISVVPVLFLHPGIWSGVLPPARRINPHSTAVRVFFIAKISVRIKKVGRQFSKALPMHDAVCVCRFDLL